MSRRILVPVDGSEQAHAACEFVADAFPDAELVLLHVINPADAGYSAQASLPTFSEEWYDQQKEVAHKLFDEIEADLSEEGVSVDREIEVGKPTRTIVEYAEEEAVDQIVMGSHGRTGLSRLILGSVAENVVRRAHCPVTIVR